MYFLKLFSRKYNKRLGFYLRIRRVMFDQGWRCNFNNRFNSVIVLASEIPLDTCNCSSQCWISLGVRLFWSGQFGISTIGHVEYDMIQFITKISQMCTSIQTKKKASFHGNALIANSKSEGAFHFRPAVNMSTPLRRRWVRSILSHQSLRDRKISLTHFELKRIFPIFSLFCCQFFTKEMEVAEGHSKR